MNILDLRLLADEWQGLIDEIDEAHDDSDADLVLDLKAECAKYEELCGELGISPATPGTLRWWADGHEPTLIADGDFEDYARELAEDTGAISSDGGWPTSYIDWEAAADALRMDYTSVTYDGDAYLIRA